MRLGWNWKVASTGFIYKRLFSLNSSTDNSFSTGGLVNLISNDVARFEEIAIFFPFFLSSFFEVLAVIVILYKELNLLSAFAGVSVSILLIPFQMYLATLFTKSRSNTAKATDSRVRFISEVINGISSVKSFAWEKSFYNFICKFRDIELSFIQRSQQLKSINLNIYFFGPVIGEFCTFLVFWNTGGVLTLPLVYFAIALLLQLRVTLGNYLSNYLSI
jgi:ATP-binding cassette subfamily C (CFTR/MRP) protein 4